jgi:hypothetical protein
VTDDGKDIQQETSPVVLIDALGLQPNLGRGGIWGRHIFKQTHHLGNVRYDVQKVFGFWLGIALLDDML